MTHDALAQSLADHLRASHRMVWCDVQLGPAGSPRPDVYSVMKSFANPRPMSYECKVSMSDFRGDVTAGKWQSYLAFSSGVVFACESGLLTKASVPEHCGLMVLTGGAWRTAKKAVLRPVQIPEHVLVKLLIDGVEREGPRYRARYWSDSIAMHKLRLRFGEIVARTIRDRAAVEHEIEDSKRQAARIIEHATVEADRIRKQAEENVAPLRAELCAALGLPFDADTWNLERAVAKVKREIAEHPAQESLRRFTNIIRSAIDSHGFKENGLA